MEKGEPTLVPEWLKNTGSHSSSNSTSHTDAKFATKPSRNKSVVSKNSHDLGKPSEFDRTTSSHFHRSTSSNGSGQLRSYKNFGRSLRDRDWEKNECFSRDKDTSLLGEYRQRGISDSLENGVSGKFFRYGSRHSQSVIPERNNDTWTKKVVSDASPAVRDSNFLLNKGIPAVERNFPSLGIVDRASIPDIGRIPSPGLNSAFQSLSIGTSTAIGAEKWTSVLAEVPVSVGNKGIGSSSVQQTIPTPLSLGTTAYLNMAETVALSPNHDSNLTQLSVETQRLEELAIRQSRQLIPVTPVTPKNLVPSSSDKLRSKVGPQQHQCLTSFPPFNHTPSVVGKGEKSKSNVGKLHVLNPVREKNVTTPIVKDNFVPLTVSNTLKSTHSAVLPVSVSASAKVPLSSSTPDRMPVSMPEKRSTSQVQSRNEFFNLVRKKSLANSSSGADSALESSSVARDTDTAVSQPFSDNLLVTEVVSSPEIQIADVRSSASLNGDFLADESRDDLTDACDDHSYLMNRIQLKSFDAQIPEEEEVAFLRSMGWEENSDETGLTEEEISSFNIELKKFINSKPALKILQGLQNKLIVPFDSRLAGIGSGLSSSDAKLES